MPAARDGHLRDAWGGFILQRRAASPPTRLGASVIHFFKTQSDLNRARRNFAQRVQEADRKFTLQNELFDPLKDLFLDNSSAAPARAQRMSKFLKTLLVAAHSDKNLDNPEESEMMTKVITAMRRRLREKS